MPEPFDPSRHAALAGLRDRLPHLAGSSFAAGQAIYRAGSVQGRAVTTSIASASVQGSGANPYRVSLAFATEAPKPGCTCPAHRRAPFCKHVVALALAVLDEPASFAFVEAPPEASQPKTAAPRAKRTKVPATDSSALRASGLESVDHLLAGLAEGGLAGLGADKQALLGTAAELVKGLKLRRLGTLVDTLQRAAAAQFLDEASFAALLGELWLVRRAVGAQQEGRVELDGGLAEDLLGKTWLARDLEPVRGLQLVQAALTRVTEGDFRVETSYFVDVRDGALYLERQISPAGLRATPKASYPLRLEVAEAGLYPGRAPRRIKLLASRNEALRAEDVARVVAHAEPTVAGLRARLVEHRSLPFDLGELPVLFSPAGLVGRGDGTVGSRGRPGRLRPGGVAQGLAAARGGGVAARGRALRAVRRAGDARLGALLAGVRGRQSGAAMEPGTGVRGREGLA